MTHRTNANVMMVAAALGFWWYVGSLVAFAQVAGNGQIAFYPYQAAPTWNGPVGNSVPWNGFAGNATGGYGPVWNASLGPLPPTSPPHSSNPPAYAAGQSWSAFHAAAPAAQQLHATRPAKTLARVVRSPDTAGGLPPYALADQAGAIQRHIEPVPGIDLEPYVNTIVFVRHDTGRTLLASQLELPPLPIGGQADRNRFGRGPATGGSSWPPSGLIQAQYLEDAATVELIEDEELPNGAPANGDRLPSVSSGRPTLQPQPIELIGPGMGTELPMWSDGLPMEPLADGYMPWTGGSDLCPECGDYCGPSGCGEPMAATPLTERLLFGDRTGRPCRLFADVELHFMRAHLMESTVGKLSEQYDVSPRLVIGFEGAELSDGRIRYWTYGRETSLLGGGSVRFDLDVLDIEATQRFPIRRSDVVLGAGLRLASFEIVDVDGEAVGNDLVGMTMSADVRTYLCRFQQGTFSWIYGGRLSILGGDWGGSPANDFIPAPVRDDNVLAEELYAGLEYATSYRGIDLRGRISFEMQNWHSDVLSHHADTDSISFLGPGVHIGADF